jgi:phage host-nuclease inhibitor protein Gam
MAMQWTPEEAKTMIDFHNKYPTREPMPAVEPYNEEEEVWQIKSDAEAEWLIDKVNEDLIEINRFELSLTNKIEILKERLEKVKKEKENKIARRDNYLLRYFEEIPDELKKKSKTMEKYRLPSGEIIKKYPAPEFKRDNEALVKWLKENKMADFIEVKESAKWADLKKSTKTVGSSVVLEETGEVIEGIEVIERVPSKRNYEGYS